MERKMNSPREYGLPHDEYRPGQERAITELVETTPARGVTLVEAPTGSGKTSFAAANSTRARVMSLVKTKMLQIANYGEAYRFDVLYGRSNYACAHPMGSVLGLTANECLHSDNMFKCEYRDRCQYMLNRAAVQASSMSSLNYALYLTALWTKENDFAPEVLYLDECHLIPDTVLDFVGTTIQNKTRVRWGLAPFPNIQGRGTNKFFDDGASTKTSANDLALAWLSDSIARLAAHVEELARNVKHSHAGNTDAVKRDIKAGVQAQRLHGKLTNTRQSLLENDNDWYIRSGGSVPGKTGPHFVARPLTARWDAPRLFGFNLQRWASVLMSATVGDHQVLADELGIEQHSFMSVPNQWAASTRPIRVLDAPKMGYKSHQADWDRQADVIADAIQSVPAIWSGIIHTSSWKQAAELTKRLAERGLGDRVWAYDRANSLGGTDAQVKAWQTRRAQVPNSLLVSPTTREGYDGVDERICIVAKTPFPNLGDDYEKARMAYSGRMYLQRTAWDLAQALGRTRRGSRDQYDVDSTQGLVAIADGNYKKCQKYLPGDIREALVEG